MSITRIGIRPNSVAPCIFVIFAILTLLARADDAPQVPPPMRTSPRATGVLLVCATAVLAGATVASVLSYRAWEDDFHFTTLAAHTDGRGRVVVDMVNHEGSDQTYRLVVSAPGVAPALDKTLNVTDGHAKNVTSTVPPNSVVEISLYRAASNLLIRVVTVDPSAFIDGH